MITSLSLAQMEIIPFLSDEPEREFSQPEWILDANKDLWALLETNKGNIYIDLFERETPYTVNSFIFLALHRYYEGVPFHRVLEGFMAQTGDPTGTGQGTPGYFINDEINPLRKHDAAGMVAMANAGPNTNGSQFYITFGPLPLLDGRYNIFGKTQGGDDVLARLQRLDPIYPALLFRPENQLNYAATLGVYLEGDPESTIIEHIETYLGEKPEYNTVFRLKNYWAILQTDPSSDAYYVGIWFDPEILERVYILEKR
ncbi:MAG: peptidylprolyl isomerase [Deinococcales bacterium]